MNAAQAANELVYLREATVKNGNAAHAIDEKELKEIVDALAVDGRMLTLIHAADPALDATLVLRLCKTYARMVWDASAKIEQVRGPKDIKTLVNQLRSHPEIASVSVITTSDVERMSDEH
jgi:hypothetical protein